MYYCDNLSVKIGLIEIEKHWNVEIFPFLHISSKSTYIHLNLFQWKKQFHLYFVNEFQFIVALDRYRYEGKQFNGMQTRYGIWYNIKHWYYYDYFVQINKKITKSVSHVKITKNSKLRLSEYYFWLKFIPTYLVYLHKICSLSIFFKFPNKNSFFQSTITLYAFSRNLCISLQFCLYSTKSKHGNMKTKKK